ncbi:MAG TPA: phenylalanine--tRNA ligase subunit beta [Solirubrobacteraceae bacterium]|jgi:phenylalanyl-tRNA synthetase beta chain|nr:phenylalanine--tRNA ligase subunit beta [Solirubrobacteraceae bacterium]
MRAPVEWLHEYCHPPLETRALADRLAMTGTEVERVERHGVGALERFVVGRVLEAGPHPNADRLSVCRVDVGEDEPAQIVCGAPNVRAGQTVAVARPGAVMPDGTKLKKAKLRGLESDGMILAEDEVAIGTEHDGIMVLSHADGLPPGAPLADVLPLATDVLELEITPNRPDCLAIYGIAREAHAATGAPLAPPPWQQDPGTPGSVQGINVEVEDPDLCPRFTARVFENVTIGPSPPWLKARLMAAGQRPISNVVDITNYVMLLTGQPLHAFDLDRVAGQRLTVRRARPGEGVETLDGQTRILDEEMVVIDDAEGPTSIAGVMGGARSEVGTLRALASSPGGEHRGAEETTRVLMEAANWNGPNIHRTSLALGLRSEASSRFEKQLQPEQAMDGQAVATQLMIELTGATVAPGTIDVGGPGPAPITIRLRDARVSGLLGAPVARERSAEILRALEFGVAEADDGLDVTVPYFRRGDVTREADLIEEVARIDGLDKLPATLPSRHGAAGRLTPRQRIRRRAADALTAHGAHEIVGWSFVALDLADRLRLPADDARRRAVVLQNPMSADQSQLRTTLLGSLLDAVRYNRAHGAGTVRVFESGAVYLVEEPDELLPREPQHVGALLTGAARTATWRGPDPRKADFYAAKGALTALLETLRVPFTVEAASEPFLHPGRSAAVLAEGERLGWLGEIHPLVADGWDVSEVIAGFELDLDLVADAAIAAGVPMYHEVASFPEVREDLAVIVADDVAAARVLAVVRRAAGPLLAGAEVFDVYRDPERIGEGKVSLALRLTFRGRDRTLTDEEVAERRAQMTRALEDELGGSVRVA